MNAFESAMSEVGYKPMTTFWQDFSIAERFGVPAIKDTFERAFKEWKSNIKYLTELVLVLNHKSWYFYQKSQALSELYSSLWDKADVWCNENLSGEDAQYYYSVTD